MWRLANENDEVKEAFKGVKIEEPESGEFAAHSERILNGLDMVINLLDHPDALEEALHHLAHQHSGRPLKKEQFKVVAPCYARHTFTLISGASVANLGGEAIHPCPQNFFQAIFSKKAVSLWHKDRLLHHVFTAQCRATIGGQLR